MFVVKTVGPDGQIQGFEAARFTIQERRDSISFLEPGSSVFTEISVVSPDGANHAYVENGGGKTIESIHRGSAKL